VGMLAARAFSIDMGWLDAAQPRAMALQKHLLTLLQNLPGLHAQLRDVDALDALARFRLDKKHRSGQFAVIGFDADGQLQRQFVPITPQVEARLVAAFSCLPAMLGG
jgi:3-dehydroquinate synthetase